MFFSQKKKSLKQFSLSDLQVERAAMEVDLGKCREKIAEYDCRIERALHSAKNFRSEEEVAYLTKRIENHLSMKQEQFAILLLCEKRCHALDILILRKGQMSRGKALLDSIDIEEFLNEEEERLVQQAFEESKLDTIISSVPSADTQQVRRIVHSVCYDDMSVNAAISELTAAVY